MTESKDAWNRIQVWIIEPQNNWGWKELLELTWSNPQIKAGPLPALYQVTWSGLPLVSEHFPGTEALATMILLPAEAIPT